MHYRTVIAVVALTVFAVGCADLDDETTMDVKFEELAVIDSGDHITIDYEIDARTGPYLDDSGWTPRLRIQSTEPTEELAVDETIALEEPAARIAVDTGSAPDNVELTTDDDHISHIIVDSERSPSLIVELQTPTTVIPEATAPRLDDRQRPSAGERQRPDLDDRQQPDRSQRQRPGLDERDRPSTGDRQRPNLGERQRPGLDERDRPSAGDRQRPDLGERQRPDRSE